jgi:hypothetical protein
MENAALAMRPAELAQVPVLQIVFHVMRSNHSYLMGNA